MHLKGVAAEAWRRLSQVDLLIGWTVAILVNGDAGG
jgi:hypothetical protein